MVSFVILCLLYYIFLKITSTLHHTSLHFTSLLTTTCNCIRAANSIKTTTKRNCGKSTSSVPSPSSRHRLPITTRTTMNARPPKNSHRNNGTRTESSTLSTFTPLRPLITSSWNWRGEGTSSTDWPGGSFIPRRMPGIWRGVF